MKLTHGICVLALHLFVTLPVCAQKDEAAVKTLPPFKPYQPEFPPYTGPVTIRAKSYFHPVSGPYTSRIFTYVCTPHSHQFRENIDTEFMQRLTREEAAKIFGENLASQTDDFVSYELADETNTVKIRLSIRFEENDLVKNYKVQGSPTTYVDSGWINTR